MSTKKGGARYLCEFLSYFLLGNFLTSNLFFCRFCRIFSLARIGIMYYYIISKCSTNKISGPKTITNLPWIFICLEIVVLVFFQDRDYCAFRTNISNKVNRRVIFSILAKPIYNTISHTYHHLPKVNFIFCKFTLGHRLHNLG